MIGVEHDGRFLGWIVLADELRPTSKAAVARLKAMHIEPVILSGDSAAAVRRSPTSSASSAGAPACCRRRRPPR